VLRVKLSACLRSVGRGGSVPWVGNITQRHSGKIQERAYASIAKDYAKQKIARDSQSVKSATPWNQVSDLILLLLLTMHS
jgi:hypothetical protein